VELPNGQVFDDWSLVNTGDSVVVVATDENDNVLIFKEYKYPINEDILCFPAGAIDEGETPKQAATRELLEETGYSSDDIEIIGASYDYPTKVQHKDYVVRIKNVKKIADTAHESSESIGELQLIPVSEINKLWKQGEFKSSYMIAAIAHAFPEQLVK
jgi:8-oxo-dGTP pyrophosphatase MutT (NUDIX family)